MHASAPPCAISDDATSECYAQLEAQTLRKHGRYISKSGNVLTLKAENGTAAHFTSNPEGQNYEEVHNYVVLGVLPVGRLAVVLDGRWEGREVHLVSLIDGTVYEMDGMPLVSPDRKRVLVHSKDLDANYDSNFIAIYRLEASKLIKEKVLDGDSDSAGLWGPGEIRWVTPSKIIFDRVSHSPAGAEYISTPWVLLRNKSTWTAKPAT